MEGWINVEMNQQQSNKAMARFSGSSHNTSDLFPPWHNYHSRSNYFPLLNRFLMTDCVFFNDRVCIGRILECCCATLSPQTVSTDLHRKGGKGRRKWRQKGVGLWRMGQAPDQLCFGPVTVPEYSRHVRTACEHKWQTDLGVCFVSSCIVFCWCPGSSWLSNHISKKDWKKKHEH